MVCGLDGGFRRMLGGFHGALCGALCRLYRPLCALDGALCAPATGLCGLPHSLGGSLHRFYGCFQVIDRRFHLPGCFGSVLGLYLEWPVGLDSPVFHLPFPFRPFCGLLFGKSPPSLHNGTYSIGGALNVSTGRGLFQPALISWKRLALRGRVGSLAWEPSVLGGAGALPGALPIPGRVGTLTREPSLRGCPAVPLRELALRGRTLGRFGGGELFGGGGVLPPFLRRPLLPLALEQLSPLAYRRFCAGHSHIRRIMGQIIGGKLHLVLGVLAGGGLPVVHQRRSVPLGADKGAFHALAHNSGLVQHFIAIIKNKMKA